MKKLMIVTALSALMVSSPLALADNEQRGEREQRRMMWFEHIDVDNAEPGVPPAPPSPERIRELRAQALEQQFHEFDLNNDGYVSLAEMTEVMERQARERAQQLFTQLDQDGTGMVDQAAFNENMRGFRMIRHEEVRERVQRAMERHGEASERMEVIIERRRDKDGRVREQRRERRID